MKKSLEAFENMSSSSIDSGNCTLVYSKNMPKQTILSKRLWTVCK